jgi:hypothetical protein
MKKPAHQKGLLTPAEYLEQKGSIAFPPAPPITNDRTISRQELAAGLAQPRTSFFTPSQN